MTQRPWKDDRHQSGPAARAGLLFHNETGLSTHPICLNLSPETGLGKHGTIQETACGYIHLLPLYAINFGESCRSGTEEGGGGLT